MPRCCGTGSSNCGERNESEMTRFLRRSNRLKGYDYSQAGYYFITVCTAGHTKLLGEVCSGAHCAPPYTRLSQSGRAVDAVIRQIPEYHPGACVDKYVIMPNHIHLILVLREIEWRTMCAATHRPSVPAVIHGMKEAVTKQLGHSIWQKSYHDHIIRNNADYLRIWQYIDTNPAKWREDCYYTECTEETP